MWIFPVLREEWRRIEIYGYRLKRPDLFSNMATEGDFTPQKKMLPVEPIFVLYFQMERLQSVGSSVKSP
jgi:hypothetical protein